MERILVDIPVVCRQCPEPSCMASCPVDALKKDEVVAVDEASCTGCMSCRETCPFGGLSLDPVSGKAAVCDLCQGDPQCVKWCPTGALTFGSSEAPVPEVKRDTGAGTARSLLANWGIGW